MAADAFHMLSFIAGMALSSRVGCAKVSVPTKAWAPVTIPVGSQEELSKWEKPTVGLGAVKWGDSSSLSPSHMSQHNA